MPGNLATGGHGCPAENYSGGWSGQNKGSLSEDAELEVLILET